MPQPSSRTGGIQNTPPILIYIWKVSSLVVSSKFQGVLTEGTLTSKFAIFELYILESIVDVKRHNMYLISSNFVGSEGFLERWWEEITAETLSATFVQVVHLSHRSKLRPYLIIIKSTFNNNQYEIIQYNLEIMKYL